MKNFFKLVETEYENIKTESNEEKIILVITAKVNKDNMECDLYTGIKGETIVLYSVLKSIVNSERYTELNSIFNSIYEK